MYSFLTGTLKLRYLVFGRVFESRSMKIIL